MRKDLWRGRIRDAREINFQKLRISRAVIGRVQHTIDIIKHPQFVGIILPIDLPFDCAQDGGGPRRRRGGGAITIRGPSVSRRYRAACHLPIASRWGGMKPRLCLNLGVTPLTPFRGRGVGGEGARAMRYARRISIRPAIGGLPPLPVRLRRPTLSP
jgi:hypothetical protein